MQLFRAFFWRNVSMTKHSCSGRESGMRDGDRLVQPDLPVIFVGVQRKAHKECAYDFFTILDNHQDEIPYVQEELGDKFNTRMPNFKIPTTIFVNDSDPYFLS